MAGQEVHPSPTPAAPTCVARALWGARLPTAAGWAAPLASEEQPRPRLCSVPSNPAPQRGSAGLKTMPASQHQASYFRDPSSRHTTPLLPETRSGHAEPHRRVREGCSGPPALGEGQSSGFLVLSGWRARCPDVHTAAPRFRTPHPGLWAPEASAGGTVWRRLVTEAVLPAQAARVLPGQ